MTKPNKKGQYRVYGYGTPPRVWIAKATTPGRVHDETIMHLKDFQGNTALVKAHEVQFDNILNNN